MNALPVDLLTFDDEDFGASHFANDRQRCGKTGATRLGTKKLNAPYRSGPSKTWIKVKNPKAPAAIRAVDGTF
jgi:hypothetical protein